MQFDVLSFKTNSNLQHLFHIMFEEFLYLYASILTAKQQLPRTYLCTQEEMCGEEQQLFHPALQNYFQYISLPFLVAVQLQHFPTKRFFKAVPRQCIHGSFTRNKKLIRDAASYSCKSLETLFFLYNAANNALAMVVLHWYNIFNASKGVNPFRWFMSALSESYLLRSCIIPYQFLCHNLLECLNEMSSNFSKKAHLRQYF